MTNCANYGKVTTIETEERLDQGIGPYEATNCYDFSSAPDEKMNDKSFYTDVLGWDEEVWDLDDLDIANGKYPTLK